MSVYSPATEGPFAGHSVLPLNLDKFIRFKQWCYDNQMRYVWGGKCVNLGQFPPVFQDEINGGRCHGCDCSGFIQALLTYSAGVTGMPQGSEQQYEWFAAHGFKPSDAAALGTKDGILRVAIHIGDAKDRTGHIWLDVNAHTIESAGGRGPGERNSYTRLHSGYTLPDIATHVFCLCQI